MISRPNLRCPVIIVTGLDLQDFAVHTEMTMIDVDLLAATAPAAMVTVTEALPVGATMMTVADMIVLLLPGPVDLLTTTRHLLVLVVMRMLIVGTILHHQIPT
jgi:hypothetical protein